MNIQTEIEFVIKLIKQTRDEIEMHIRMQHQLELKLANLEVQRNQLEDEICIDVEMEPEDNSIDQDKKFVLPDRHYRVPSDDEEEASVRSIKQEANSTNEDQQSGFEQNNQGKLKTKNLNFIIISKMLNKTIFKISYNQSNKNLL